MNVGNPVRRSEADGADQFNGRATPVAASSNVMKATTGAESCTLTTSVSAEGVSASRQPTAGGKAAIESEVMVTGESSFMESGTIRFGDGNHQLRF